MNADIVLRWKDDMDEVEVSTNNEFAAMFLSGLFRDRIYFDNFHNGDTYKVDRGFASYIATLIQNCGRGFSFCWEKV